MSFRDGARLNLNDDELVVGRRAQWIAFLHVDEYGHLLKISKGFYSVLFEAVLNIFKLADSFWSCDRSFGELSRSYFDVRQSVFSVKFQQTPSPPFGLSAIYR